MSKKKLFDGDVFSAMTTAQPAPQPMPVIAPPPLPQQNFQPQETTVLRPRFVQIAEEPRPSTEAGLPDGMTRATIIVSKDLLEKVRDIAYWDRLRDQDVYAAALSAYVESHEKRLGRAIDPRPTTARRTAARR